MSAVLKHRRGGVDAGAENYLLKGTEEKPKQLRRRWDNGSFLFLVAVAVALVVTTHIREQKPMLPIPNVDIKTPNKENWPLVHIVSTRFMQEQGPLTTLGMARLKLFLTFCLPSMIKQSNQNFFWIIKTDPQFTKTPVFESLIKSVQAYHNIYVVASNNNFFFGSSERKGSWRDGKEAMDLLKSKIYTGNTTKLHMAMALRNDRPVLETRLDADDGLHVAYINYIQQLALDRFQPYSLLGQRNEEEENIHIPQWLYWCSRRHIEWHSDIDRSVSEDQMEMIGSAELGYMNVIQHSKLCVTPGITIGFNINSKDVPQHDHDKLYRNVRDSMACYEYSKEGNNKSAAEKEKKRRGPCLELVEDFSFCAIRSRTWTSAGMYNIDILEKNIIHGIDQKELTKKLWTLSKNNFGIDKTKVKETQNYLIKNKKMIAYENLLGQCTNGHSCKDKAKEELNSIIAELDGEER